MTRIKVCGLSQENQALAAVEAGADFIGLVFASSPRQVTPARAKKIAGAVKKHGYRTELIGVFVNTPSSEVNEIADTCHLDRVQLSGDESPEYCHEITRPVIKVMRVSEKDNARDIHKSLTSWEEALSGKEHVFLLDSKVKGRYGGTGIPFNWSLARTVAREFPLIIAGGLTPENVPLVIKRVKPWGVDVSSGVEVGGVKHIARIRAFIKAVRKCDDNL
ncbi:phosphoribosylanthranilate isomerase [Chloroflexota bacterium]